MDEQPQLKQRLIGAIVLVALGIIFIPMILDGGGDEFLINGSTVPPQPEHITAIEKVEINTKPATTTEAPVRIPVDSKTDPSVLTPAETTPQPLPEKSVPKKPVPDKQDSPSKPTVTPVRAWAVQVGSFSQHTNAMKLSERLRNRSYTAFVEKIQTADTTVYRVRVGPYTQREKAEAVNAALADKYKIKGLVVSQP